MPTELDYLERIRLLELENSELRDKLDMIYAIVAPEDHHTVDNDNDDDDSDGDLIQIQGVN